MNRFHFLILAGAVVFLSSCAELQHLDEALTLQAYSKERDAQEKDVALEDKAFDQLLAGVKSGDIPVHVQSAAELERRFGQPILKTPLKPAGTYAEWLYRYQVKKPSPKVYVLVGPGGEIKGFRCEE
ncbi:MAG: hypothetical protein HQL22_08835 [Candidatus Omnitrophica bacterium]|nr:hypothetical protein [Candidatus Omnitrophota bacterium]